MLVETNEGDSEASTPTSPSPRTPTRSSSGHGKPRGTKFSPGHRRQHSEPVVPSALAVAASGNTALMDDAAIRSHRRQLSVNSAELRRQVFDASLSSSGDDDDEDDGPVMPRLEGAYGEGSVETAVPHLPCHPLFHFSRFTRNTGTFSKWTNYLHGWQERWLTLRDGVLAYYKSPADKDRFCRGW